MKIEVLTKPLKEEELNSTVLLGNSNSMSNALTSTNPFAQSKSDLRPNSIVKISLPKLQVNRINGQSNDRKPTDNSYRNNLMAIRFNCQST